MAPRVFGSLDEFTGAIGDTMGPTEWLTVTQQAIDEFASSTGDHQWIHTDPERAKDGPFGTTIAHGYWTLSTLPSFAEQLYEIRGLTMGLNYGANRVRFPDFVPVGSRIRATATLQDARDVAIGTQLVLEFVIEKEGGTKPVCLAEVVYVMAG